MEEKIDLIVFMFDVVINFDSFLKKDVKININSHKGLRR